MISENMELDDVYQLQEFMEWCRDNGVLHFQSGNLTFQFSEAVIVDKNIADSLERNNNTLNETVENPMNNDLSDEELLYWSTNE